MEKVYLSGCITVDPLYYKEHFKSVETKLKKSFPDWEITNPSADEYDDEIQKKGHTDKWTSEAWLDYIKRDVELVSKHTSILLLRGWEDSMGVYAELASAKRFNLKCFLETDSGIVEVKNWNIKTLVLGGLKYDPIVKFDH